MRVEALMHSGDALPKVAPDTAMPDVIHEMSSKRLGMACVLDGNGRLRGIVTDGDLRRHMTSQTNLLTRQAQDVMTRNPVTIGGSSLAAEAIRIMEERKITSLVVVGAGERVEGVVHLHDLWRTEMI
jgi:arabinose-5-phosphate isomerase